MRPLIQPTVRRARVVITVSEQSKREILQTFALPSEQVRVIYEAAAPAFSAPVDVLQDARRRAAYGWSPNDRHVLHVGTHQPRKNVPRLVTALHLVHQTGLRAHLWLVGQVGWGSAAIHQQVEALGLEAFVHFAGYVPVRDLRAFYRGCDVFVFPSLHEGFGLPVLEAMACGAPVAVAETPTLREIAGDAAEYFDPENTNRMADTMRQLLTDAEWARALGERGRARAELFSWERTARETHAVYAQVANGR